MTNPGRRGTNKTTWNKPLNSPKCLQRPQVTVQHTLSPAVAPEALRHVTHQLSVLGNRSPRTATDRRPLLESSSTASCLCSDEERHHASCLMVMSSLSHWPVLELPQRRGGQCHRSTSRPSTCLCSRLHHAQDCCVSLSNGCHAHSFAIGMLSHPVPLARCATPSTCGRP
jgi:hypothetical protein